MFIKNKKAKILGRVCMHMTVVDAAQIPDAAIEDEVIVIGKNANGDSNILEIAEFMGTNINEVLVKIPKEIPRYYL